MNDECSDCGASLGPDQLVCGYCGKTQNPDEQLLIELMDVKRKYETAYAHGNKLVIETLLAEDYELVEVDGGIALHVDRKSTLENAVGDERFLSYSITDEELLERTSEKAKMACVQTVHRQMDGDHAYRSRAKIDFTQRGGRWQIAREHQVTIDENGQETVA